MCALAGCSIGTLNAAVIASAPDLHTAAERLGELWREVSEVAGPAPQLASESLELAEIAPDSPALLSLAAKLASPVLRPSFLEEFITSRIDAHAVAQGLPLWVSVFPSLAHEFPQWSWIVDLTRSKLGAPAKWLQVNKLPENEVHHAVLASSAIPLILPTREVAGRAFVDGGLGDNIPAGALVANESCDVLVVVHLNRGQLWDAHRFPVPIIEIRPRQSMRDDGLLGGLSALLDFSPARVTRLMRSGYEDATAVLDQIAEVLGAVNARRRSQAAMLDEVSRLNERELS